jgi:hypothetical protein
MGHCYQFFARQRRHFMIYFDHQILSRFSEKGFWSNRAEKETPVNTGHISALETKHAELEAQLERENTRPFPDSDLIHRLKKQKLQIKDTLLQERAYA